MKAVLLSSHQEVARIDVENLGEVWCIAGNPNAEDLIKVICADGKKVYWCDSIEFIDELKQLIYEEMLRIARENPDKTRIELMVERVNDKPYYIHVCKDCRYKTIKYEGEEYPCAVLESMRAETDCCLVKTWVRSRKEGD